MKDLTLGRCWVFRQTPHGWEWWSAVSAKWLLAADVPAEVQRLYAAEGWATICWQEMVSGHPLCYPILETAR